MSKLRVDQLTPTDNSKTINVSDINNATVIDVATGLHQRSLSDKLTDIKSVKDFGAKGDGTTDDSAAFQEASNYGGAILVPVGTYIINSAVNGYGVHFIFTGSSWSGTGSIQGNISYFTNAGLKVGRDYHWRTQSGVNSSLVIGEHLAMQQDDPGHLATLRIYPEGGLASPTQIAIEPYFISDVNELHSIGNGEDITSILCGKSTQPDGSEERGGWVFKEYADGSRYRHHRIASFATINGTPRDIHVVVGDKRLVMFDYANGRTLFDNSNVSGVTSKGNTIVDVKNGNNSKVLRIFAQASDGEKGIAHLTAGTQDMKLVFDTNALRLLGNLTPTVDNQGTVGSSSLRFNAFYSTNGAIQTSDEREKEIEGLTEGEINAACDVAKSVIAYRWKNQVTADGVGDRRFGVSVQKVMSIMDNHGLNWRDYSMFSYDEETDRYGMNYSELLSFAMAGIASKA